VQVIETGSGSSIRVLSFDLARNTLYACCAEDGRIYGYHLGSNLALGLTVTKTLFINGPLGCRSMQYIPQIDKLAIGYTSGMLSFYDTKGSGKVFCKFIRLSKVP
jgi:hypothetical protein